MPCSQTCARKAGEGEGAQRVPRPATGTIPYRLRPRGYRVYFCSLEPTARVPEGYSQYSGTPPAARIQRETADGRKPGVASERRRKQILEIGHACTGAHSSRLSTTCSRFVRPPRSSLCMQHNYITTGRCATGWAADSARRRRAFKGSRQIRGTLATFHAMRRSARSTNQLPRGRRTVSSSHSLYLAARTKAYCSAYIGPPSVGLPVEPGSPE